MGGLPRDVVQEAAYEPAHGSTYQAMVRPYPAGRIGLAHSIPRKSSAALPRVASARRLSATIHAALLCMGLMATVPAFAATPEFATVTPDHPIVLPQDTGAHPAFRTEWWYATGWLTTPDNQPLGFQITFFRSATGHDAADPSAFAPSQLIIAHAALSDPALGHLTHDQRAGVCEAGQYRRQTRRMENHPCRRRPLRRYGRRERIRAAPRPDADTSAPGPGRTRLLPQRSAARAGELLLQRAAIARNRQRRSTGCGRQQIGGRNGRYRRGVARSRMVEHAARYRRGRMGLARRQPDGWLGLDGFQGPQSRWTRGMGTRSTEKSRRSGEDVWPRSGRLYASSNMALAAHEHGVSRLDDGQNRRAYMAPRSVDG
jgi:hypothetical protein